MQKIITLAVILVLSGAFAQGRWFGEAAVGQLTLVPDFGLSMSARMGMDEVLGPLALRGEVGIGLSGGSVQFSLIADTLFFLRNSGPAIDLYFGGGAGLVVGDGTVFGIRGVTGIEFPIYSSFVFITEASAILAFQAGSSNFNLQVVFGPRLYFR